VSRFVSWAPKYAKNAFAAGAPPLTPMGKLTGLPIPVADFKGPTSKGSGGERMGGEMKERVGEGRGKWRESGIPALLFPHFEPCPMQTMMYEQL